jgi:predicted alpha/beta-fold hydrolase
VIKQIKKQVGEYKPPIWYHPLLGAFNFSVDFDIKYERHTFTHDDGSVVDVDWYPHNILKVIGINNKIKLCIHFCGVGTTSETNLSKKFASTMFNEGYICCIVNARGKFSPIQNEKLWHPARTDDSHIVLNYLCRLFEENPSAMVQIIFVGFSGGTTTLYNTLFECFNNPVYAPFNENNNNRLSKSFFLLPNVSIIGAVVASYTYDYKYSIQHTEKTLLGKLVSRVICNKLTQYLLECSHVHHLLDREVINNAINCKYLSEFDSSIYPIYGYKSLNKYFESYSTFNIDKVRVPWLAIQPADDLSKNSEECIEIYVKNERVIHMTPSHGNHLGFFESDRSCSHTYLPRVSACFGNTVIELENL